MTISNLFLPKRISTLAITVCASALVLTGCAIKPPAAAPKPSAVTIKGAD